MEPKRVDDSLTEQTFLLMPKHSNGYGRLFGGMLVAWIDEVAGIVSRRHCQTETTTVNIDNLTFKESAHVGDMIVLLGRITYVGRTSMEVRVDTYVEDMSGKRKMINRAYLVMVSVDKQNHPLPVPGLLVESEREKAEWYSGEKRYALRRQRRLEGY